MTFDEFMHYAFWAWLFVAVSFTFFLIGRIVGYREGYNAAKDIYKVDWND